MIDTLHLVLSKFIVVRPDNFTVVKYPVKDGGREDESNQPVLFRCPDGTEVRGKRAMLNCDQFRLTILRIHGAVKAILKVSVPKLYSRRGINLYPIVYREQFIECLSKLSASVEEIGLRCDLVSARLSQVDIFRNVDLRKRYPEYLPLLKQFEVRRLKKRLDSHGTTIYWNNSQEEIVIYDKSKETKERYWKDHGRHIEFYGDILRCEYRMQKPGKVRQVLGIETVGDLIEGWEVLPEVFNSVLERKLFRHEPEAFGSCPSSDLGFEDALRASLNSDSRNWMNDCLRAYGVLELVEQLGSEGVENIVRQVGGSTQVTRIRDLLAEAEQMIGRERSSGSNLTDLYSELRGELILVGKDLEERQFFDSMFI